MRRKAKRHQGRRYVVSAELRTGSTSYLARRYTVSPCHPSSVVAPARRCASAVCLLLLLRSDEPPRLGCDNVAGMCVRVHHLRILVECVGSCAIRRRRHTLHVSATPSPDCFTASSLRTLLPSDLRGFEEQAQAQAAQPSQLS